MDMLGGYGSDAGDSDAEATEVPLQLPQFNAAPSTDEEPPAASRRAEPPARAPPPAGIESRDFSEPDPVKPKFSQLPSSRAPGMPVASLRKLVQFKVPFKQFAQLEKEEDEAPKKKLRQSTVGKSITDILPAPSHSAVALGLGSGKRLEAADSDEDEVDPVIAAGEEDIDASLAEEASNEAFRVDDVGSAEPGPGSSGHPGYGGYGAAAGGSAMAPDPYHQHGQYGAAGVPDQAAWGQYAAPPAYDYAAQGYTAPEAVEPGAGAVGDAALEAALRAEAEKTSRHKRKADPFADLGVKFVEVDQKKLTHMETWQKEAKNATVTAFGPDYESRLRGQAGPKPDKLAKRKHQMNTLFYEAKMKELEAMEMRSQAIKSKRETQAKYGW